MRAIPAALCFGLIGIGCSTILGPRDVEIEMRTDRESYPFGDEIALNVTNLSRDTLIYEGAGCVALERRIETWEQIGILGECIFIAYPTVRLAPGDTQIATYPIQSAFEPGAQYRFFTVFERSPRRSDKFIKYSNIFHVTD